MGWSWSLHWAQKMHEHIAHSAGLEGNSRIVDRTPPPPLSSSSSVAHAIYVDNYVVIGPSKKQVTLQSKNHQKCLEGRGLPVHEITDAAAELD